MLTTALPATLLILYSCLVQVFSECSERPYTGLSAEQTAVYVINGGRLDCPSNCDDDVYSLMSSCWRHRAERRPSAGVVHRRLAALRSASSASRRRFTATTPPPPPLRPANISGTRRLACRRTWTTTALDSLLSDQSLEPDHVSSSTDVITRSAAVRIRNSFRKFVTSVTSRSPTMTSLVSPLTSPTRQLSNE